MHATEFDLYGVFVPATVAWMLAAFAITAGVRAAQRVGAVLTSHVIPMPFEPVEGQILDA